MATFVKRGDSWQAKVRRKGYPTVSRSFDTKAGAERWARGVERSMDNHAFVDAREAARTTLLEALERYEREVTPRKKGATQERNRIAKWKRDPLAMRSLASLRGSDLAKWRDQQLAAGLSSSTVRLDLAVISHLFTIASREWGLESLSNPVQKITAPAPARARDRRLAEGEEKKLLDACAKAGTPWLKPLVQLAIETGMRQGELLALTWSNVDLGRRVARLEDTKNGEARNVPLSSAAASVLQGLARSLCGRVFPLTQTQAIHHFRKAAERAKIEGLRFHDLRHEATSRLFEKGLNPMEVSAVTGHKTLHILKRYTHLRAEDLAERLG